MIKLNTILEQLEPYRSVIDADTLAELRQQSDNLELNIEASREQGRNLRIAVVGQMKAGKSSLLNAAILGQELLPQAITPMTAALTRIVYAPQSRAIVTFYTPDDWANIVQLALEYSTHYAAEERKIMDEEGEQAISPFGKRLTRRRPAVEEIEARIPLPVMAAREVVDLTQKAGLNLKQHLGGTETLDQFDGVAGVRASLEDFVGSAGRYTAITKMVEVHVNDPRLKGLEIIDTPGFNDPVVSRGALTRSLMGKCDVVLLVSSLGQFLDKNELSVLREQLPEAGLDEKAILLVGSQRDLALRQDPDLRSNGERLAQRFPPEHRDRARFDAMCQLLDKQMAAYASQTLTRHADQPGLDRKTRHILAAVGQESARFSSAWAWLNAGRLNNLSEDDQYHFSELVRVTGYQLDEEAMRDLSNIPALTEEIHQQVHRKQELIRNKEQALRDDSHDSAIKKLQVLRRQLQQRAELIRTSSIDELESNEQEISRRMTGGQRKLEDAFEEQAVNALQKFALLRTEVQQFAQGIRVEAVRGKDTESYSVSTSSWYNPFSWGRTEKRYRDVISVYASAQDAIEQVQNFALKTTKSLQQHILQCVDIEQLRRELSVTAMALFDTSDAEFDAELMLLEVKRSLRRITIPNVSFGEKDYSQQIIKSFGSDRVSEGQIEGLRKAQHEAVAAVLQDLKLEIDSKLKAIEESLERTARTFVNDITCDIQQSLRQLREQIAAKESSLQLIKEAMQTLDRLHASA